MVILTDECQNGFLAWDAAASGLFGRFRELRIQFEVLSLEIKRACSARRVQDLGWLQHQIAPVLLNTLVSMSFSKFPKKVRLLPHARTLHISCLIGWEVLERGP